MSYIYIYDISSLKVNVNKIRSHSSLYEFRIGATDFLFDSRTLKMGPIGRPETSVKNYHSLAA